MINNGIIKNIDSLNRVVIPIEMRKIFYIDKHDSVEFFIENEKLMLVKYERGCVFCGEAKGTIKFKNKLVCRSCIEEL